VKLWIVYSPDAARDHCIFGAYDNEKDAKKARAHLLRFSEEDGYGWMRYEIIDRTLNENRG